MNVLSAPEEPILEKTRHIKYWTRCLKTLLPHHYTGNESNRMYLAFFIISALDILGAWESVASSVERRGYVEWIYHCQHPRGGFRMWPGTDFGEHANETNAKWDPANVPATYFALSALLIVGDDLARVKRKETLQWLRHMQRPDGSFGETIVEGRVEGGSDPRFGYCATGVRRILRGDSEGALTIDGTEIPDINIDALVNCILQSESFDGGIADQPFHEPHAGYTFCSLGAIKFIDRLHTTSSTGSTSPMAPKDPSQTLRWLITRQTELDDPEDSNDSEFQTKAKPAISSAHQNNTDGDTRPDTAAPLHQSPDKSTWLTEFSSAPFDAGMNGRINKVADTCYAWWGGASFHILQQPDLYDHKRLQRYLLGKTQHSVLGGFGKFPGDLPDLYHSYMGLAALGISGCADVHEVDAGMCISRRASARLQALWQRWKQDMK